MGANAIIKRDSSKMGWGLNHVRVDLTPVYVKVKSNYIPNHLSWTYGVVCGIPRCDDKNNECLKNRGIPNLITLP